MKLFCSIYRGCTLLPGPPMLGSRRPRRAAILPTLVARRPKWASKLRDATRVIPSNFRTSFTLIHFPCTDIRLVRGSQRVLGWSWSRWLRLSERRSPALIHLSSIAFSTVTMSLSVLIYLSTNDYKCIIGVVGNLYADGNCSFNYHIYPRFQWIGPRTDPCGTARVTSFVVLCPFIVSYVIALSEK